MLHNGSRFFNEELARGFTLTLAEVARTRPKIALLENVLGMLRVWEKARLKQEIKFMFFKHSFLSMKYSVEMLKKLLQAEKAFNKLKAYGYLFAKASCA